MDEKRKNNMQVSYLFYESSLARMERIVFKQNIIIFLQFLILTYLTLRIIFQ